VRGGFSKQRWFFAKGNAAERKVKLKVKKGTERRGVFVHRGGGRKLEVGKVREELLFGDLRRRNWRKRKKQKGMGDFQGRLGRCTGQSEISRGSCAS